MTLKNNFLAILFLSSALASCVGPEYKKPEVKFVDKYKYDGIIWEQARPSADVDRGEWWKIYNDQTLNSLIDKLNRNNQDVIKAAANYKQALAIIDEAKAAYFPSIDSTYSTMSQKSNQAESGQSTDTSNHSLTLSGSWSLDIWTAHYNVVSDTAGALSNKAYLALTRLSAQSSLAQYYYEIRGLDIDQEFFDAIVVSNKKLLEYTNNRYKAGVNDHLAVLNAKVNLETAISNAENNRISRNQYQNAIAVLIGEAPSSFNLAPITSKKDSKIFALTSIPINMPSTLLQRRPDIAQAEQLVIQANAQIGIARTAFFPSFSLNSSITMQGQDHTMGQLLTMPAMIWSMGPEMTFNLFDGGLRRAQTRAAWATYEAQVASYRQTVLNAFSEVEDQLVAITAYNKQAITLNKAAKQNKELLTLTTNQYKAGTVDYSQILNAQINYYNAAMLSYNAESSRRTSEILLIKALGGGWNENDLKMAPKK